MGNFLGTLGGIGAGLMTVGQINRQAEQDKINNRFKESQVGLADVQLKNAKKAQENEAAYGAIAEDPRYAGGTQTFLGADAPVDEWGNPQVDTIDKPADRRGAFSAMAQEALKRGDQANYERFVKFDDHLKKQHDEGVTDIAKMVHAGSVDPAAVEKTWNSAGSMRVVPGSVKWDADTGVLSGIDSATAQPISVDKEAAKRYLTMNGTLKPDEYASAGDGVVFNKRTGAPNQEAADLRLDLQERKDVAAALRDDKRFAAMLAIAEKRGARGDLGGKQPTHVATAEWLKEKGIAKTDEDAWHMATQLGEQVNEKVTVDQLGNTTVHDPKSGEITRIDSSGKKTIVRPATKGAAKVDVAPARDYLAGATDQKDFTRRVQQLKTKGWTDDQIRQAAE